jgi:hypothetical protein
MYNFIHRNLVKDGNFPYIIQPNHEKFVLLVGEQSPHPGEDSAHSRAGSPLQHPGPPGLPWLRLRERERDAGALASAAEAQSLATGHFQRTCGRSKPRLPGPPTPPILSSLQTSPPQLSATRLRDPICTGFCIVRGLADLKFVIFLPLPSEWLGLQTHAPIPN